jgi:mono/diheme cytochrome c family protein
VRDTTQWWSKRRCPRTNPKHSKVGLLASLSEERGALYHRALLLKKRYALTRSLFLKCAGAVLGLNALALACSPAIAGDELTNPYLGDPAAIEAGKDIYRAKCYGCHHSGGARGLNLFATKLSDERFLETVINGRKNTQMPAFGLRLSPDEVWQVHAYVKSTDHYQ